MNYTELLPMVNEDSKKFLSMYFKDAVFVGITERCSRNHEFFAIYKRINNPSFHVAVLSKSTTNNNGCCIFGDIRYFSLFLQEQHPINKGEKHPFLFDVKTEREINTWLNTSFDIPLNQL